MNTVYSLRSDFENVASMQRASLDAGPIGLQITHGLVGSEEWWGAIERGALTLHSLRGSISGFWPGQGGLGPAEFELLENTGAKSTWLCGMEPEVAKEHFRLGRVVEMQFVIQELKTPFNGTHETKLPIAISVV